jgi:hypothetical protein
MEVWSGYQMAGKKWKNAVSLDNLGPRVQVAA